MDRSVATNQAIDRNFGVSVGPIDGNLIPRRRAQTERQPIDVHRVERLPRTQMAPNTKASKCDGRGGEPRAEEKLVHGEPTG